MEFKNANYDIEINRGTMLPLLIKSKNSDGTYYVFQKDDVVRFNIMEKKKCNNILVQKDVTVTEPTEQVSMILTSEEMTFGEVISKEVDYWYEILLNPNTPSTQVILGYTKHNKARILTLLPTGGNK